METVLTFLSFIFPYLAGFLGAVATRFLLSLGFGIAAYSGVSVLIDTALDAMEDAASSLPSAAATFLQMSGIPTAINILLGAYFATFVLKGLSSSGSVRRVVWGDPK